MFKIILDDHLAVKQREKFDEQNIAEGSSAKRIAIERIIPNAE